MATQTLIIHTITFETIEITGRSPKAISRKAKKLRYWIDELDIVMLPLHNGAKQFTSKETRQLKYFPFKAQIKDNGNS